VNRYRHFFPSAFLPLALASASTGESPPRIDIVLANFSMTPANLHLKADQPVTMAVTNKGWEPHNFNAPEFFMAATMDATMRERVGKKGRLDFFVGQTRLVTLTPKAGVYPVSCQQFLHADFGMKGTITVD
jgi:uncharacterized cupredoxin-like copper-binding protein